MECTNDASYDIWRSFDSYDQNITSLKGWVALVTRHRSIDKLRKRDPFLTLPLKDFAQEELPGASNPAEVLDRKEEAKRLSAFIKALPEMDRSIFIRRFFCWKTSTPWQTTTVSAGRSSITAFQGE